MDYDLIKLEKKFKQVGIEVSLVDEVTIRRLNKKYKGVDSPTAVLSFYYGQVIPKKTFYLGEIIICLKQARNKGLTFAYLINHGLKNLLSEISAPKNLRVGRRPYP